MCARGKDTIRGEARLESRQGQWRPMLERQQGRGWVGTREVQTWQAPEGIVWTRSRGAPERLKGVEKDAGRFCSRGPGHALPKRVWNGFASSNGTLTQRLFSRAHVCLQPRSRRRKKLNAGPRIFSTRAFGLLTGSARHRETLLCTQYSVNLR
jgi:hypothetical protein